MHAGEAIVVVVAVLLVLLPWLAVRDVLRHPRAAWATTGRSRVVWVAVIVLVPVLGAAFYIRRVRPRLRVALDA